MALLSTGCSGPWEEVAQMHFADAQWAAGLLRGWGGGARESRPTDRATSTW